jgi:hypothetical protein
VDMFRRGLHHSRGRRELRPEGRHKRACR